MTSARDIATRRRGVRFMAVLAFLAVPFIVQAAPAAAWGSFDLPKLQQTMLKSASGSLYRIVVATPAGLAQANGYPVIYIVDGNAWTSLVSEIIRTNIETGVQSRVEPAVVVGIGYPIADAFDLTRRTLDFTFLALPSHPDPGIGGDPNGGDIALMDFIDAVVKPVTETRFKIDRSRQTLVGHSLGGLFVLSTMFNRPQSFQTYVALSPSIWWDHRALLKKAQDFVARPNRTRRLRVFLSIGAFEQDMTTSYLAHARDVARRSFKLEGKSDAEADKDVANMKASFDRKSMVDNVCRLAAILTTAQIQTRFVEFPDEDHFSVVPSALGRAIPFALSDDLPAR